MIHMERLMPRKKKTPSPSFQTNQEIALLIYKILTNGSREAKAEVVSRLIFEEQIEFLDQIKSMLGIKEYYRVVEIC